MSDAAADVGINNLDPPQECRSEQQKVTCLQYGHLPNVIEALCTIAVQKLDKNIIYDCRAKRGNQGDEP
jgi:hypothetical protein